MAGVQSNVIRFNDLTENDTVVLETENNVYRFRLKDRNHQMGTLAGGSFPRPSQAVLGGTMVDGDKFLDDRLMVGGRILFFSQMGEGGSLVKRIVTSPVARMHIDRAA
jgi:hypothetical protein